MNDDNKDNLQGIVSVNINDIDLTTTSNYYYQDLTIGKSILDTSSLDFSTFSINYPPPAKVTITDSGLSMADTCDIKIGNVSIKDSLERIEERLNILTVNPELEKDWESLRILGQRYRALEKEILEKTEIWDILKKIDNKIK